MAKTLPINSEEKMLIRNLLNEAKLARDALPYTEEFLELKRKFADQTGRILRDSDFWIALVRVGKTGGSGKRKPRTPSPKLSKIEKLEIIRLLPEGTGARDRLAYTPEFNEIHRRFLQLTKTSLSKRDFWLALLSVAKSSRKPIPIFVTAPRGNLYPGTVEVLETANPWWLGRKSKETHSFRRWAFNEVWQKMRGPLMPCVVMSGPRRVGKSVIKDQILEELLFIEGVDSQQILHIQFDDMPFLGSLEQPIFSIVRWYEKQILGMNLNEYIKQGKKIYFFFDEIQNLRSWAAELKNIIDRTSEGGLRLLATGSSSLRIRRDQEHLVGRVWQIDLGPLRLREIAGIRGLADIPVIYGNQDLENWTKRDFWLEVISESVKYSQPIEQAFNLFSRWGGFPFCHNKKEANIEYDLELADFIVDSIIDRTINQDVATNRTGRTFNRAVLSQTFKQICRYTGQEVKADSFRREIDDLYHSKVSHKDVIEALQFFEDSMLMCKIPPLEISARRQKHGHKLCLCDHFLRQIALQEKIPISPVDLGECHETVSTMAGHIVEGLIGYFLHSIPALDIAWFPARRNEPELDFVLTMGLKRLPLEVKYRRGKPKNGDSSGIRSFCNQKKYNAEFGLLITQDYAGPISSNVIAIPASTFLSVL